MSIAGYDDWKLMTPDEDRESRLGRITGFRWTDETATEVELRELFDQEPDEELADRIPVCAGEWRREGDAWRMYAEPSWESEA